MKEGSSGDGGNWSKSVTNKTRSVTLVELTVLFDTLLDAAAKRKEVKYLDIVSDIQEAGRASSAAHHTRGGI